MSVEILEERLEVVEVSATRVGDQRCVDLGGAAIACAGCPFVRFCELKASVTEVDTEVEKATERAEADWPDLLDRNLDLALVSETDLFAASFLDEVPAQKTETTPLPHDVENTTPSYFERLMDDDVDVVLADSIAPPPRAKKTPEKPELTLSVEPASKVEEEAWPEPAVVAYEATKPIKPAEARSLANEKAVAVAPTVELAADIIPEAESAEPVEEVESREEVIIATRVPYPEAIFDNTLAEMEEVEPVQPMEPEILTQNILRPIAKSEIDYKMEPEIFDEVVAEESAGDLPEQSPAEDEPEIVVQEDLEVFEETIEVEESTADSPAEQPATPELFDIPELVQTATETEEYLSLGTTEPSIDGPESRLAEALLNGDDTIDPEQRLATSKKKTRWNILRELALRALLCSF